MTEAKAKNTPKSNPQSDNPNANGYAKSEYTYPKTKKVGWHRNVIKFLRKIAGVIRSFIHILGEIGQHVMDLIAYVFSVVVKLATSPTTPIFFAIILVLIVGAITLNQWWEIGVWLARLFKFNRYAGGVTGALFGIGLNSFQLAPILWKISRDLTDAYREMGVNTDYEPEEEETPQTLERNWFSANHRSLKTLSAISYCVETAIVISYVSIAQKLAMLAIAQAAISLRMPEESLKIASHTISLLGTASRKVAYRQPPESEVDL